MVYYGVLWCIMVYYESVRYILCVSFRILISEDLATPVIPLAEASSIVEVKTKRQIILPFS